MDEPKETNRRIHSQKPEKENRKHEIENEKRAREKKEHDDRN